MLLRFPRLGLAGLLFSIWVAPPADADTIRVTSGDLTIAWDDPSSFGVFAEGLALTGLFVRIPSSPQQVCFTGCTPGTIVDLSSVAGGNEPFSLGQSMTAVVNGVTFATPGDHETWLGLTGTFSFDAGSVVLPPMEGDFGRIFVTAPFLFQGQVAGFASGDEAATGVPLFRVELNGQGTASLGLSRSAQGVYAFPEVTYTFEAADPIPEPATILLFSTGAAGLALRRARVRGTRL